MYFQGCNYNAIAYKTVDNKIYFAEGWVSSKKTCDQDHDADLMNLIQSSKTLAVD